jgi:hypothetical protein
MSTDLMPTRPNGPASAVSLLDEAFADLHLVRACLDELREADAALVSRQTLVGRAERCLDDAVAALRSLRVRVADVEGRAPQGQES